METATIEKPTTTYQLGNYSIDLVPIALFKNYYYENLKFFSSISSNAFLKALDIPPKFFKEQPEDTQKILFAKIPQLPATASADSSSAENASTTCSIGNARKHIRANIGISSTEKDSHTT